MNNKKRLVIVGSGMAGTACVEEILKTGKGAFEITVLGKERHSNYNRVLLSQVLTGEKTLNDITTHAPAWYDKTGVRLLLGRKVTAIERGRRVIVTEDGAEERYDKLILALGSRPIVPDIPGAQKEGVVAFRDLDDCERLRGLVTKNVKAAVIGGGLLGLEAAHALRSMGAEVTVVHLADRLMERQLDAAAAGFLKEDLEKAGMRILLNAETIAITGEDKAEGVRFKDGSGLEAGVVVMCVGIRPNTGLAEKSGVYCKRGIVVSDTMQTYDPAIYAVGECVEHRGATFGLVAQVFEQARVAANHLAGDARLTFKNRPTAARLKIPGIDLYSAGAIDGGVEGDSIEYCDRKEKVYKRVILREGKISGIIMYGDTLDGPKLFGALTEGSDVSTVRGSLLLGGGGKDAAPMAMTDETVVCGCNGITKGMIREAIEKKSLFTVEDVKRETKAATSCGGCSGVVARIIEETLGSNFEAKADEAGLCPCTKYARADILKNIRERELMSVREVMDTLGWETVGCEICRPAINYYVGMVWPKGCEDDATSRLVNERVHANIQKDGQFSVVPRLYGGVATPAELKRIADAAIKYNAALVKITGGQRIALIGVRKEDLPNIWNDLGMDSGYAYGKALRTVKTCVGAAFCRYGTQDSLGLGVELEKRLGGLWMPAKVKLSVSGCPRNCSESAIKDIGIVGINGGWEIYAGGCGGVELKAGHHFCTVKTKEEVIAIAGAFIQLYREEAEYTERTFKWIRRAGLDVIKKAVVENVSNRKALLERLDLALSATTDPWRARINGDMMRG